MNCLVLKDLVKTPLRGKNIVSELLNKETYVKGTLHKVKASVRGIFYGRVRKKGDNVMGL